MNPERQPRVYRWVIDRGETEFRSLVACGYKSSDGMDRQGTIIIHSG